MSKSKPPAANAVHTSASNTATLRQKAEARWQAITKRSANAFDNLTIADTRTLLHDLQVHQIELEMQNEELLQAKDALEASRARYVDLYDLAPVGYCTVNEAGLIAQTNLTLATLLGVARAKLLHQAFSSYVLPEDQDAWYALRQLCLNIGQMQSCELRMQDSKGTQFWASLTVNTQLDTNGTWDLRLMLQDVSAKRLLLDNLQESEDRFRMLAQDMPLYVSAFLADGTLTYVNAALAELVGTSPEQLIGSKYFDYLQPDDVAMGKARLAALTPAQSVVTHEQRWTEADGQERIQEWTNRGFFDNSGKLIRLQAVGQDITERKRAEARQLLASKVFNHARDGIIITDVHGTIIDVNEAFAQITGYDRKEVMGQNPRILSSGRQDAAFYSTLWSALTGQGHWSGEIWNRRKDGEVYAELLTISSVRDAQGVTQQYVALFSDITAIKAHQSQLEYMAHFDALTHLPNRLLLADRLQQAMAQAQRRGQQVAVAYLDLDGFKNVNDRHGHEVGDQLLIALSNAMKDSLREGDTLARIGGDEFVAVLIDLESPTSCLPMLTRLLEAAAAPVQLGDLRLQGSASVGVTFYPQAVEIAADQLLRQADQSMYQAKQAGKNQYHVFDAAQDSSIRVHHESLGRVRQALEQHEFVLHYQPKVNMRTGAIIGVEALIRWQHPDKGLLAPGTFLPVIEDHPLAVDVGEWVIDTALNQIGVWHAAGLDMPVSVNIGARQLQQGNFVERLQVILAKHPQVIPVNLELEVLETSALADMTQVSQVIEDCAQMGVKFALDDFGTGYSSLTYLKRLRVAMLKIDQSFVRDMLDDPDDLAILEGIIGLAVAFKREVIAEGVETVAHGTLLLQLGCELAQGFGVARPMPAEQLQAWAATWQLDAIWCALRVQGELLQSVRTQATS